MPTEARSRSGAGAWRILPTILLPTVIVGQQTAVMWKALAMMMSASRR